MKKTLATLILISIPINAFAEKTVLDQQFCKHINTSIYEVDNVEWTGTCKNGFAYGYGTQIWIRRGKTGATFTGFLIDGKKASTIGTFPWGAGAEYTGQLRNGLRHGKGIFKKRDGHVYDGYFLKDKLSGEGLLKQSDGVILKGNFENGILDGKGTYRWPNGDIYEGFFKDGKFNASGSIKDKDGNLIYEGRFSNDLYHGNGKLVSDNGLIYNGDFKKNVFHGEGELADKDGKLIYKGSFRDGEYHGHGYFPLKDGRAYEGNFDHGTIHGKGKIYDEHSNPVYVGKFERGKKLGIPEYEYKTEILEDGTKYTGQYKNGQFDGKGVLEHPDGGMYDGEFKAGLFHGKGIVIAGSGKVIFDGEFINGQKIVPQEEKDDGYSASVTDVLVGVGTVVGIGVLLKELLDDDTPSTQESSTTASKPEKKESPGKTIKKWVLEQALEYAF